jgi:NAD(P)-dependent dehydrogenase (short-subunit alcohol dehydrogenase family)
MISARSRRATESVFDRTVAIRLRSSVTATRKSVRNLSTNEQEAINDLRPAAGRLAGRVAIVVGGGATGDDPETPGTGEATARVFAAAGATVCVVGRTEANTLKTVDAITADGGTAIAMIADVTETATCERLVDEAVTKFGRLDILVNNLGYYEGGSIADADDGAWDRSIAVNLRAPIAMTRAAVPHLRNSPNASIINVSAVSGVLASESAPYGTTKAAMIALTRDMASGLGRDGIRANCLVPGHLHTPSGVRSRSDRRELRRRLSMTGAEGTGWDLAWAALFLASDQARFITATVLPVDGGVTQQLPQAAIIRLGLG